MKQFWKRINALVLTALIVFGGVGAVPVLASETEDVSWPAGPEISTPCAIVMEANTGTILYEKNADEVHYPASITKIMTTLLAIENCSMDEVVTFSEKAVYENEGDSSHIARDVNEQMTMEQCLYAVMLESANECAFAVAEHIGDGDYQVFVDMMNAKAEELGCTNTHFNNPNGLPDESHVTTCRDMALIAKAAIENSTFRQITGTVRYTIPPTNKHSDETLLNNHHQMLSNYKGTKYLYDGCIGGKTGYTTAAGSTLVTYAERDGMLLICVLMNSQNTHYEDTATLFDYCFENYKMYNVSQNETRFADSGNAKSLFGEADAFAELNTEAQIILPVGADFADTETEVSYDNVTEDVAGTLVYSYGGQTCGMADVVLTGASGSTYEFGEAVASSDDGSADEETVSDDSNRSGSSGIASFLDKLKGSHMLLEIIFIVVIVVVAYCVFVIIYKKIRRYIRRKRRRNGQYKVIKENKRWRRRRCRR